MERRLIDDLVDLELYTESIAQNSVRCRKLLDSLLSSADKSFDVLLHGDLYTFYYPTTKEEEYELSTLRKKLIDKIMLVAFETGNWNYILAFASGIDPKEMQLEKVNLDDLYPVLDNDGNKITALPLNEDSHIIKTQRINDDECEEFDEYF